ncbi:hypothetical protein IW18_22390 [Flavobacterium hibernum]|uniref:Uncharacterized protein n=1 Tax=Flavobacterium hibernum TaxID=37752 RepID=A0A0D0EYH0_9FLAO|nr:hypothetical protein IW18_22390 [Flavobacterium hibernum]OXA87571.1 hypothetical protein B0A73_11655 [Flavobacterium hibernum]STO14445.1 Uncharacterised protein [Flavobacterium hibernum]
MKKVFTNYMFLLLISFFLLGFLLAYLFGDEQSFAVNKTVGWAYSISNEAMLNVFLTISQILFIFGYLIIFLLKRKTNYYISLAHFEIILVAFYSISFKNFIVSVVLGAISIILFFINIYKSQK